MPRSRRNQIATGNSTLDLRIMLAAGIRADAVETESSIRIEEATVAENIEPQIEAPPTAANQNPRGSDEINDFEFQPNAESIDPVSVSNTRPDIDASIEAPSVETGQPVEAANNLLEPIRAGEPTTAQEPDVSGANSFTATNALVGETEDETDAPLTNAEAPRLNAANNNLPGADRVTGAGSFDLPDDFIRNPENGTIPASTVEAVDEDGNALTGDGAQVGIISDSFNQRGGYLADIQSGDLPTGVNIVSEGDSNDTDEGRAMAQIIHDIAPDADLAFHNAFGNVNNTDRSIATAYDTLADQPGIDIIVDDVASLVQPIFQESAEAIAQEDAVAGGISVFSSFGNASDNAVQVNFNGEAGDWVDFDPNIAGIQGLPVTYGNDETPRVVVHWDDPYASLSPNSETTADFDLFFVGNNSVFNNDDRSQNDITRPELFLGQAADDFAGSDRVQINPNSGNATGVDPFEFYATRNNTGNEVQGQWAVQLASGEGDNRTIRMSFFGGTVPAIANDPTTLVTSQSANGVGAVHAYTNNIESFTSEGPNTLLFDNDGNRLPVNQQEEIGVDFLAPDGINTTFFGSDSRFDPDSAPNFFGTSAAAPSAAAVNALLLEQDPTLTPTESTALLSASADGRGSSDIAGSGLINAQAAYDELIANRNIDIAETEPSPSNPGSSENEDNEQLDARNLDVAETQRERSEKERLAIEEARVSLV